MKLVHLATLAAVSLSLGACQYTKTADPVLSERDAQFMAMIPTGDVDKMYARYMVDNPTGEPPGVVVVETKQHLLYYTMPDGKAMRYGVALGSQAFGWTGEAEARYVRCHAFSHGHPGGWLFIDEIIVN